MNSPVTNVGQNSIQQLVFPPDRGVIGVLAVNPPYPPGYKPQSDSALGININMVHGDRDGLLVYILAYLNMAVGDYIKVYIATKNAPVAEFPVTDAHFDAEGNAKNIPFYISAERMEAKFLPLQPENKNFWFEVDRVSGNSEESPPVPLFYKYPAPGEPDTDGGKPFNQGIKLPIASESVVDQTVINDGMFMNVQEYFNQSIGDVVVLAFGSLLLEITVTALGDIIFELTPEMLATLAPTNSLVVRWEVFDVVENSSGWSDALVLTYKPGVVLLAAPIFEQADPHNVHHDGLAGGVMSVLVTGVFTNNDLIELTLEGLTKGGDPVTHTYSTLTTASTTVRFSVENERVRNLIGGSLHASYKLIKAGKTQLSKPADVTITGTSQPLGLPIVEPLVDNKLPVDTAMATVQVAEYWPLKKGATVEARWQTTDQDGIAALFIFRVIVTDPIQPVIFQVPAKYIAPYASTPLTVQCTITNPGEVQVFSELLQLTIGEEAKIELLPPFLVKPAVSPIDPLGDPVTVRVEYLEALDGDKARLVEKNSPSGTPAFPLTLLNKNKRANFVLDNRFLVAHLGMLLHLFWNLNRDGKKVASSESMALTIKPIATEDPRLPTPEIEGATTELDVTKLLPTALLTVAEWLGQALGQCVWLRYDGFDNNDAAVFLELFKGEPHNASSGFSCPAAVDWLSALGNGTVLTISFSFNPDGIPNKETAILFPVRRYQIKAIPALIPGDDKSLQLPNFITAEGRLPAYSPQEATFTQVATGGTPPLTYSSDNARVATVTSQGGTVTCRANGSTKINVTDANGMTASYTVSVSGIKTMLRNDASWRTWPEAYNYCQAKGGRLATLNEMLAFYNLYAREGGNVAALLGWPLIQAHHSALYGAWVADGGGGSHYYFNLTGTPVHGSNVPYGLHGDGYRRPALCLIG
ncbi:Ig-like domain-containing protein [Pseudomonas frederiksbergensis]|uniref:Ig-like domain-containing protein n=1 Tax=Pseudomonas frederiksbergensis TaxID=104087 RepID=UPI003D21A079